MATDWSLFLDDRDYAHPLISTLDIESQLLAMRALIRRPLNIKGARDYGRKGMGLKPSSSSPGSSSQI